jgi:hypothetical protein
MAALAVRAYPEAALLLFFAVTSAAVSRASVTTSDACLVVRNPFRRHEVPWRAIDDVIPSRRPKLILRNGASIKLEGVEPFPAVAPSDKSLGLLDSFVADVRSHLHR